MRVLVVDDERTMRDALARALRLDEWDVQVAGDGLEAIASLDAQPVDVMVLDVGMPGMDGLDTCRVLRARGDETAILLLTARDGVADRVAGLDAGADDYMVKPFALDELRARLRALTRRARSDEVTPPVLRFADVVLDVATREVHRNGRMLILTRLEFALLELLLAHPGQVLSREMIHDRVWGYDCSASSNSLEVYVGYLRRKLEQRGEPRIVHTVRGVGYVLRM